MLTRPTISLLLISLSTILSVSCMDDSSKALLKQLAKTRGGFKVVHSFITEKQESRSDYIALDLADDRTKKQLTLKIDQLPEGDQQYDNQAYILQRTVCTPEALNEWGAKLPEKPSPYFKDLSKEADQKLARFLVAATHLPTKLKNQYLAGKVKPTVITKKVGLGLCQPRLVFGPHQKYLLAKREPHNDTWDLYDLNSRQPIKSFCKLHVDETPIFSTDGTHWIMQCAQWNENREHYLNGYGVPYTGGYTIKTTKRAFNLKTKKLIKIPEDKKVVAFSSTGRFALLRTNEPAFITFHDTQAPKNRKHLVCPVSSDVSFSPHDRWCAYQIGGYIKLINLQTQKSQFCCNEIESLPGTYHDTMWAGNGSFCVIAKGNDKRHHENDPDLCKSCKDGDECCLGNALNSSYSLYDPATNKLIHTFEQALLKYPPVLCPNSRYCYLVCEVEEYRYCGHLYDVKTKTIIKTFKDVNRESHYQAHFAQDPDYPYCVIHLTSKKVIVFDCAQQKVVPEIDDLEGVANVYWPKGGPYYAVSNYPSLTIKEKKTHNLIMECKGDCPQFSPNGTHCTTAYQVGRQTRFILVDLIQKKEICKFEYGLEQPFFEDGSVYQMKDYSTLCKIAPADPDWSKLTSQQLFCILYAYQRCKERNSIDFWLKSEQKLHCLFESLEPYMQTYVAKACNVIEFKKDEEDNEKESESYE